MKKFTSYKGFFKAIIILFGLSFNGLFAQTPGLIYEPATGAGKAILDPNGDGYVSLSPNGFTTDDQLQSEIPYSSLVFPMVEPNSDLGPGPDCGFTDFVDQGDQDPVQSYLDAGNNWLFRLRMGNTAPNAKSYSILIDTDGKFGGTGPNADPNYSSSNPGFEIEIVLSTKFGVFVYDVNNMNCTPVISYAGTTNYQKSIALTTSCGNPDYFYDFFLKFSDLTTQFGITPVTKMRMAIVDNMAANKSTLCNATSASDLAGIDDASCGSILENCFGDIIDNYTPCAPGVICPDRSVCPTVNGSINAGASNVSGTSSEANGTVIKVYINGVAYGTTTTVSAGVWTLSGISPALIANDVIGAAAIGTGKGESEYNCSLKTVGATCSANPTSASHLGKSIQGIAPVIGATINVYQGTSTAASVPTSGSIWNAGGFITVGTLPSALAPTTDNFLWKCVGAGASTSFNAAGPACLIDGAYRVTATEPGKCESSGIWICVGGGTPTGNPTFTTTPILTTTASISGSVTAPDNVAGVTIYLYSNGTQIGTTTTGAAGAWTIGSLSLISRECETLSIKAIRTATSLCPSTGSVTATIKRVALAPTVNGPICSTAAVTSVSGTSVEAAGTIIQVYENGIAEGSTTTVAANGTWTASTGISIALGSTITAKASGTCISLSDFSNSVLVGTKSSNAVAITKSNGIDLAVLPIYECATSVSGTGTNGDVISLYIDGFQIGGTATVAGGVWTIGSLDTACYLYTGGVVTAKATTGTNCEGTASAGFTVVCVTPSNSLIVTPASKLICSGSTVAVTVQSSESGIIYQLFNGATASGTSKLGTGGDIILTSSAISSATTLTIKAIRLGNSCIATLLNSVAVTIDVAPTTPATTVTQPTCATATGTITVTVQTAGETYSFDNGSTFQIGNSKSGLIAGTYDVIIKSTGGCNSTATTTTINAQPAIPSTPSTSVTQPTCATATGAITVTIQNATDTYSFDNGTTFQASNVKSGLTASTIYDVIIKNTAGCLSLAKATTVNAQPALPAIPPVVNCWDNFVFNTGSCAWDNTGTQSPMPAKVNCWDNFVFNTGSCAWDNTGTQSPMPAIVNCWDNFVFNTGTCSWDNTGSQTPQPAIVNCWDNFVFNTGSCSWDNTGTQSAAPDTAVIQPTCATATGTISVTVQTAGETYSFDNGASFQASNIISGLAAGSYNVIIKSIGGCNSATAVTVINLKPICALIAVDDTYTVAEDSSITLTPLAGDTSVDTLNITSINGILLTPGTTQVIAVSNGTVNITTGGVITFTPVLNFNSATPISIPYVISDSNGGTATANELITVTPVNDAPIVDNDVNTTTEDNPTVGGDLTDAGDSDPDGTPLLVTTTPVSGPTNGSIVINTDGTYVYTPNPNFNGTDVITIEVCDSGSPLPKMCVNETLTITVTPVNDAPKAVNDTATTLNDTNVIVSVASNDTDIDGTINLASVDLNPTIPGIQTVFIVAGEGTFTANADGTVTFDPLPSFSGTTTPINYSIQDNLGAVSNNGTITVTVFASLIVAKPDIIAGGNGGTGNTNVGNVLNDNGNGNDTLYGINVAISQVNLTITTPALPLSPGALVPSVTVTTGQISVPAGTPAGIYTIIYSICDKLNPSNCSSATIIITVLPSVIDAVNDDYAASPIPSYPGGTTASVIVNDKLNNLQAIIGTNPGQVKLTPVTVPGGLTLNNDGTIIVAPNTAAGTYVVTYSICEVINPANCETATAIVFVSAQKPSVALIKIATAVDENGDGFATVGETIRYNFFITNTGNVPLTNITITDLLPGLVLTGGPITLSAGQQDTSSFVGIYKITQTDAKNEEVTNQATISGTSPLGIIVKDLSDNFSNTSDGTTVLAVKNCEVEVSNTLTPNGDGINDYFHIEGLDCFSVSTVKIYNRWGVLVFETEKYNNTTNVFEGNSRGRTTINQSIGLPIGTYFYVLEYIDFSGNGVKKAGYLYLNR